MKRSILEIFESKEIYFSKYDINVIDSIDKMLENPLLEIEVCKKGYKWYSKRTNFKYNMKLSLRNPNISWLITDSRKVNVGNGGLEFVEKMIKNLLNENGKHFENSNQTDKKSILNDDSFSQYSNLDDDFDDYDSERRIMRDLERGEGYKHGLD